MNRVLLTGRITHDLELKYTNSGIAFVNFSIAVNRSFTNEQGEREADFFRVVAWRGQAENIVKYVRKGSLVGIDGRLQSSSYETPQGEKRTSIDIVADSVEFLEPKSAQTDSSSYRPDYDRSSEDDEELYESALDVASEDDLPF